MGVEGSASDVANRVLALAAEVFELDGQALSASDSPQTIERWDSINHLKLITATEAAFGVRFKMQTVVNIQDLAALIDAVQGSRAG